jgi:hypothetical protein
MRNALFLLLVGACAARAPQPTLHAEYTCGDVAVTRAGSEVKTSSPVVLGRLSWRDGAGDHFVAWPVSPTDRDAVEFIVPTDPHQDAVQQTYDTTFGSSTHDWRLVDKKVCPARGGYNDLLTRYMMGESIDTLAVATGGDREETRGLLRKALMSLQRRYWRDQ